MTRLGVAFARREEMMKIQLKHVDFNPVSEQEMTRLGRTLSISICDFLIREHNG